MNEPVFPEISRPSTTNSLLDENDKQLAAFALLLKHVKFSKKKLPLNTLSDEENPLSNIIPVPSSVLQFSVLKLFSVKRATFTLSKADPFNLTKLSVILVFIMNT